MWEELQIESNDVGHQVSVPHICESRKEEKETLYSYSFRNLFLSTPCSTRVTNEGKLDAKPHDVPHDESAR